MSDHELSHLKNSPGESRRLSIGGCASKALAAVMCVTFAVVAMNGAMLFWGSWWEISHYHAASVTSPFPREVGLRMLTITFLSLLMWMATCLLVFLGVVLSIFASLTWQRRLLALMALTILLITSHWVTFHMNAEMENRLGRLRMLPTIAPRSIP